MENLNINEIFYLLTVLAIAAAVAGFMAGLLGVGGGIIMVPALYYAFTVLDFDIVTRMHLAVGTSLAIIIPTSIISTLTHREHDAVDFNTAVSLRYTSLRQELLYAVVPFDNPSFDGDAKPSISPSDTRSRKLAKLLLCKVSGVLVGCGGCGGDGLPPAPCIIFFVMPLSVHYLYLHL